MLRESSVVVCKGESSDLFSMISTVDLDCLDSSILSRVGESSSRFARNITGLRSTASHLLGRMEPVESVEALAARSVAGAAGTELGEEEGSAATVVVALALAARWQTNPLRAAVEAGRESHADRTAVVVVEEAAAAPGGAGVSADVDVLSQGGSDEEGSGGNGGEGEHLEDC